MSISKLFSEDWLNNIKALELGAVYIIEGDRWGFRKFDSDEQCKEYYFPAAPGLCGDHLIESVSVHAGDAILLLNVFTYGSADSTDADYDKWVAAQTNESAIDESSFPRFKFVGKFLARNQIAYFPLRYLISYLSKAEKSW